MSRQEFGRFASLVPALAAASLSTPGMASAQAPAPTWLLANGESDDSGKRTVRTRRRRRTENFRRAVVEGHPHRVDEGLRAQRDPRLRKARPPPVGASNGRTATVPRSWARGVDAHARRRSRAVYAAPGCRRPHRPVHRVGHSDVWRWKRRGWSPSSSEVGAAEHSSSSATHQHAASASPLPPRRRRVRPGW